MANLIPQIAKKKVTTEYWLRVTTAWFLLWTVGLVIASVLLFPIYIFTNTQVSVNAESARVAEETVADHEAVSATISEANNQAKLVIESERIVRANQYLDLLGSLEGQGVTIAQISFTKSGTAVEPIRLTGQAVDRESLAAFRDRLLAEPSVEEVDLPISNLAKDSDIQFDIVVTMDKDVTL